MSSWRLWGVSAPHCLFLWEIAQPLRSRSEVGDVRKAPDLEIGIVSAIACRPVSEASDLAGEIRQFGSRRFSHVNGPKPP